MRMWMIDPQLMCQKHIRGEHAEIHKHRHLFERGISISGRLSPVIQIQPESMKERHDELAEFLQTHQSPYTQPDLSHYPPRQRSARVDPSKSLYDLWVRCPYCREIIEAHFGEAIL